MDKFGIPIENFSQTLNSSGINFQGPGTATGDREFFSRLVEDGLAGKHPRIRLDSTYKVDGIEYSLTGDKKGESQIVKLLSNVPDKKEMDLISQEIKKLTNSKTTDEYLKILGRIQERNTAYLNTLLDQTSGHFFNLAPSIKQLKRLEHSFDISIIIKTKLKEQALKKATNIVEFLAAIRHTTHMSQDYIEAGDLLLSKYFNKFLNFNPTLADLLKLEGQNIVRPQIASEIYDRLARNFKDSSDFIEYIEQREKLKTSQVPRRKFLFTKLITSHYQKYGNNLTLKQLQILVNSNLIHDDIHAKLASKALEQIKTKKEFKGFKFRKEATPAFENIYKEFIEKNPTYTFFSNLNCVFNQLIGR
jgi:hypothetical protein